MKHLSIIYFLIYIHIYAQTEGADTTVYFNKIYNPDIITNNIIAFPIVNTLDEGYTFAGSKFYQLPSLQEVQTLFFTHINKYGQEQWTRHIYQEDFLSSITSSDCLVQNNNGNLILVHVLQYSPDSLHHIRFAQYDSEANLLLEQIYDDFNAFPWQLIATKDGGYAIAGASYDGYDMSLIKTDQYGFIQWRKQYDLGYISQAFNVIESPDGGYVLSGNTRTEPEWDGNTDMQLLKTDSFGNMQWEKKIGKADNWDCGALVAPLNDSTFLLHGCFGNSTLVEVKPSTMYIAHLHYDDGSVVYENQYETQLKYGVNSFHGQPLMLANNDYIGVASTDNELNERIASIIKHNQWGEVLWQKFLTVNADKMTYLKDIERTADGGFVACGFQYEPPQFAWVVKLDSLGNTCWKIDCDSLHIVPWTVGIDETFPTLGAQGGVSITPNPATDKLFIHSPEAITNVAIYNTLGQQFPLLEGARGSTNSPSLRGSGGVNETQFGAENELSVAHLASGIYFVQAHTKSGRVFTQKFVKR